MFCENFEPRAVKMTTECDVLLGFGASAFTTQYAEGRTRLGFSEHPDPIPDEEDKV